MTTITTRVTRILSETLGVDLCPPTAAIIDDLGADSLDLVEVIMALEQEFGIEIPDDDFPENITVGEVVDLITRLTQPN